jgi:hypothetical protein
MSEPALLDSLRSVYQTHTHFPLLRLFIQRIRPSPKPCVTFRNNINFLRREVVRPTPESEAGVVPLVGCPQLLIQYIRRYPAYLDAVYSICTLNTRHSLATRDPLNLEAVNNNYARKVYVVSNVQTISLLNSNFFLIK